MILKPDGTLEIVLGKNSFKPGDAVSGRVKLTLKNPVMARRLMVSLKGEEWVYVTCGGGKSRTIHKKELKIHYEETELSGDVTYRSAEKDFKFILPSNAPPTILLTPESIDSRVKQWEGTGLRWIVQVKLDIPLGLDLDAEQEISVS